jgi:hypothetical protein
MSKPLLRDLGEQRQQERQDRGERRISHGAAPTGLPRKLPVSDPRYATVSLTCWSVRLAFNWASPIFLTASSRVGALPSWK